MFLASDRSGYAARREVSKNAYGSDTFFVGALRKHACGMFLASDRRSCAPRRELVEGLYLPNFLPFFPQGKKVTPPLHLQIRFAEIRRHVRADVGIRPCGTKDENFLSQTRLPYEGSCQPQG